jgi:hypothetical protein
MRVHLADMDPLFTTQRQHTAVLGVGRHAEPVTWDRLPSAARQIRRPEAYVALRAVTVLIEESAERDSCLEKR